MRCAALSFILFVGFFSCKKPNPNYVGGSGHKPDAESEQDGGGNLDADTSFVCADDKTYCKQDELCLFDPQDQTYRCTAAADCPKARACGTSCCTLGSRCVDGACPLSDLTVEIGMLEPVVEAVHFDENACEVQEGCIGQAGTRMLMRFSRSVENIGEGDFFMGPPAELAQAAQDSCHGHWHLAGLSHYALLDDKGNEVGATEAQNSCLRDGRNVSANESATYTCAPDGSADQGLQPGWADERSSATSCQWIDVTGVRPGNYALRVSVNQDGTFAESDMANNVDERTAHIPSSCPMGCPGWSPGCCDEENRCDWGGDGFCDCEGEFDWEVSDCANCNCWIDEQE